jgi:ADP-ribose pyrophosphatase YjhB (NUDIX family)
MNNRFKQIVAVHLFLINNDHVLLARRCNTGYEDGKFSVPAGHVDKNESCLEAMIRETKEEVNIQIKRSNLKLVHIMHRKKLNEHRVDFFFECNDWSGKVKINEEDRCDKLQWFSFDQLPNNLIPYVSQAITKFRVKEIYSELGF